MCSMWAFLHVWQIISFIPLLKLDIPENLRIFLTNYLSLFNFKLPISSGWATLGIIKEDPLNQRFADNGYEYKDFFANFALELFIWLIILCCYPISWLAAKITKMKFFINLKNSYQYSMLLRTLHETFIELSLCAFLNLYSVRYIIIYVCI